MQTLPIDSKSYPLYVVKNYTNDKLLDVTEFNKDAKLFKNVKSNINRYYNNNNIDLKLIINQIVTLQNQFKPIAVSRILFYLIKKEQHSILISILSFLNLFDRNRIPECLPSFKPDITVYNKLKEIYS